VLSKESQAILSIQGHLEKLLSRPIACCSGVNVYESEREQTESFAGNFAASKQQRLFFEVPSRFSQSAPDPKPPKLWVIESVTGRV
jgi:hypothetical protein